MTEWTPDLIKQKMSKYSVPEEQMIGEPSGVERAVVDYLRPSSFLRRGVYPLAEPPLEKFYSKQQGQGLTPQKIVEAMKTGKDLGLPMDMPAIGLPAWRGALQKTLSSSLYGVERGVLPSEHLIQTKNVVKELAELPEHLRERIGPVDPTGLKLRQGISGLFRSRTKSLEWKSGVKGVSAWTPAHEVGHFLLGELRDLVSSKAVKANSKYRMTNVFADSQEATRWRDLSEKLRAMYRDSVKTRAMIFEFKESVDDAYRSGVIDQDKALALWRDYVKYYHKVIPDEQAVENFGRLVAEGKGSQEALKAAVKTSVRTWKKQNKLAKYVKGLSKNLETATQNRRNLHKITSNVEGWTQDFKRDLDFMQKFPKDHELIARERMLGDLGTIFQKKGIPGKEINEIVDNLRQLTTEGIQRQWMKYGGRDVVTGTGDPFGQFVRGETGKPFWQPNPKFPGEGL